MSSTIGHGVAAEERKQALIRRALSHLQRKETKEAEALLLGVLAQDRSDADALQLMGIVCEHQGRRAEAGEFLRRSLKVNPSQPHVHVNLGNVLLAEGDNAGAIRAYRTAIRLRRDYADAYLNLGNALHADGDEEGASRSYREALKLAPGSTRAALALGMALNALDRPAEAQEVFEQALRLNQADRQLQASILCGLGDALRLQRRYEDALQRYDAALGIVPGFAGAERKRGDVLQHLGHLDEAAEAYRRALVHDPSDTAADTRLNGLLYRLKRDDEILSTLARTAAAASPAMALSRAEFLMNWKRFAEAQSWLAAAGMERDEPVVQDAWARSFAGLKQWSDAIAAHERALRLDANNPGLLTNFAVTLLKAGDAEKARDQVLHARAASEKNLYAISVLSIASRMLGDETEDWLNGYEEFVQSFDLEPPAGYEDIEAFHRDLQDCLGNIHIDKRESIDLSLRGGTQTYGNLFEGGHGPVDRLRARIDQCIGAYIARMKDDPAHPFLSRRSGGFSYSGSWSSRLADCGYHVNHIHDEGWISACYYVAVPDVVADGTEKQGWIKFGEPGFEVALERPVRRFIQPKPGRLVLFPSYMWHGTVPFHSSQTRTTVAFDVVPS